MNDKKSVVDTLLCSEVINGNPGEQKSEENPTNALPTPYQSGRETGVKG